jgi:hypothetical protein
VALCATLLQCMAHRSQLLDGSNLLGVVGVWRCGSMNHWSVTQCKHACQALCLAAKCVCKVSLFCWDVSVGSVPEVLHCTWDACKQHMHMRF